MREHLGEDVASANIVIEGRRTVLVRTGDELVDALRQGQGVLNVLSLAPVKDELDARVLEFRRADAEIAAEPTPAGEADAI